jgi:hypothetical protein
MRRCRVRLRASEVAVAIAAFFFSNAMFSQQAPAPQAVAGPDIATLQQLFQNPPDDSRIMMRWWWFGPAVTKPELEREIELMKSAGVGGFEVQPVYPLALDDPTTGIETLPFLSDEFIDALRFVSEKAHDLGIRMDLTLGSGWPYGGPQVPVRHAAGQLRLQRSNVDNDAARLPIPSMAAGEKLLAVFLARFQGPAIIPESVRQVSAAQDGTVELPPGLTGSHEMLFFISSRTGMMVKRPAVGAEGFVVDHYDMAAVREYQTAVGDRLMQAFSAHPPYAVFCDSLEVFQSDWTGDFLDEFAKRRGYDLKPYLPALMFDMGPKTEAIRHDWGKTLTELFNERFVIPMREWARQKGTLFRMQGYGMPPAELSSNALADLPEGEGPQWKVVRASRWASSASHLYGRPVTSSETWTWIHSPVFRATPLDLKAEADLHFLQGINQLVGHGWPYTAEGVEYPGWRFYAAGALNNQNPWWIVMPDVSRYLQRLSALLRQGQPVNDVALYLPNSDAWAHLSAGRVHLIETLRDQVGPDVMAQVLEAGFNLDFFDDDALRQVGRIGVDKAKGVLELGPGRYRVVILPGVEHIPQETLQKLADFARSGGVLIATRRLPSLSPGFLATGAEHDQIRDIARSLFEGKPAPAYFVKDEKQLGSTLSKLLQAEVSLSTPVPDIGFVHRRTQTADIYFVANTGNAPVKVNATLRAQGRSAEWWDPISGRISTAQRLAQAREWITVPLNLAPYASTVLVVSGRSLPARLRTGRLPAARLPPAAPPIDLSRDWQISFGQGRPPKAMERLRSWTEDKETRYFSGLATYERNVAVPKSMIQPGLAIELDFGEGQPVPPRNLRAGMQAWLEAPVRDAAVVYVNGQRAGAGWCPPFSLDITPFVKPGMNRVKIVVGNLAVNYMAGHSLPDYRLLNLRYGVRFEPQDLDKIQPVPAGLLGPIRLVSVTRESEYW